MSYIGAGGVRRKQKVVAHTRTQALAVLEAIRTKVQKEEILGVKHASDISLSELFDRFRRYQKVRLRQSTFERLDGILNILKAHLPSRARDITRLVVADFVNARLEKKAEPATVAKEMATLSHALRMAIEWELLHENPAKGAKLPKLPKGRTRYLSPPELKAALAAAHVWMRAPIALAAFTGMRRGEILNLKWADIDVKNHCAYLPDSKNGEPRPIPLNSLAMQVIESLPFTGPRDAIITDCDPERLSVETKRLFGRLGMRDASFHSLRHTTASWLTMSGVDLYSVGQILGHKTPRMTQRYAHLSPQYLAGAAGRLDSVFGSVLPPQTAPDGLSLVPVESPLQNVRVASGD